MPGVTWSELDTVDLPNLEGFLAGSALASLAPARVVAHRPGAADAYVTFGAGTRGVGLPGVDGDQFDAEEIVGDVTAGEVFERRTGCDPQSGVVSLGFPSLRRENASLPYDIELGAVCLVGDELRGAGVAECRPCLAFIITAGFSRPPARSFLRLSSRNSRASATQARRPRRTGSSHRYSRA
jgi:hypothetical protein